MPTTTPNRKRAPEIPTDEIDYEEIGADDLTPSQEKALRRIWRAAWDRASNGGLTDVEVKEFNLKPIGSGPYLTVSVVLELGRVGDENTAASVFCRTRGHFFVGSHGGIRVAGVGYSSDFEGKRQKTRRRPLIYGWTR